MFKPFFAAAITAASLITPIAAQSRVLSDVEIHPTNIRTTWLIKTWTCITERNLCTQFDQLWDCKNAVISTSDQRHQIQPTSKAAQICAELGTPLYRG